MTHFCRLAAPALMAAPWQPDASLSHISPWASSHGHEGERSQVPQVPARSPDGRSMTAGRQPCLMASLTLCSPAHLASEQAWSKTGGKEGGLTGVGQGVWGSPGSARGGGMVLVRPRALRPPLLGPAHAWGPLSPFPGGEDAGLEQPASPSHSAWGQGPNPLVPALS